MSLLRYSVPGFVFPGIVFNHLQWKSWGAAQATARVDAYFGGPGEDEWLTLTAFDLGRCQGRLAYRALKWPGNAGQFDTCTGRGVGPGWAAAFPLTAVDWPAVAQRLLGCGSFPAGVGEVRYVQPAAGVREALVLANCQTGASTWPSGLFAFDLATSRTSAHLAQVLIDPGRQTTETSFETAESTITARIAAYSSWSVPNCCPDLHYTVSWGWQNRQYTANPANAVGPVPLTVSATASSTVVHAGQTVTYSVKITNIGPQTITSAWLFVAPSNANAQPSRCGGTTTCQLGDLAPGASTQLSFSIRVPQAGAPFTTTVGVTGVLSTGTIHASGTAAVNA